MCWEDTQKISPAPNRIVGPPKGRHIYALLLLRHKSLPLFAKDGILCLRKAEFLRLVGKIFHGLQPSRLTKAGSEPQAQ